MVNLQATIDKEIAKNSGYNYAMGENSPQEAVDSTKPIDPTREVGVISSQQGQQQRKKDDATLANLELDREDKIAQLGEPKKDPITTQSEKETEGSDDFVTYINPETGAEKTLKGDEIYSSAAKASLEASGFIEAESSTSGSTNPAVRQAQKEMRTAEEAVNNFIGSLEDQAISSRELRSTIRDIQQVYGSRITAMQEVNRRRIGAISTLGVRLGSRYMGGSGGVFGGIITEEERQGLDRISAIEAEMLAQINGAKIAAKEHNFTVYNTAVNKAQELFNEKKTALDALKATAEAEQEKALEEAETLTNQASVIEQINLGVTDPLEIFEALDDTVPYDVIKEITDTMPGQGELEFKTGSKYQPAGTFDPSSGEFTPLSGITVGGSGGGYVGVNPTKASSVDFPTDADLGSMGTDERDFVNKVMRQLPTKLKDSEKEKNDRMKEALFDYRRGREIQEVVDELNGYVIQDSNDAPLANVFRSYSVGSGVELSEISAAVNNGNPEQAMTTIENAKLADAEQFFGDIDEARTIINQSETILSLLESVPVDKLGSFDGRKFKVDRFAGLTDKDMLKVQQLETALAVLNSPVRVSLVGTAGTEGEMQRIQALQADILDQPDIIKTIVTQFKDDVLNIHNQARSQRGLPTVDNRQLTNNEARLELYRKKAGQAQEAAAAQMSNNSLLGLEENSVGLDQLKSTIGI